MQRVQIQKIKRIFSLTDDFTSGYTLEIFMNGNNDLVFGNNDVKYFNM